MTVGELVYQQMKDGYVPTASFPDGSFISVMNRTAEESQKLVETLRKPFENMQKTMERLRPSLEAMENLRPSMEFISKLQAMPKLAPPFIPALYEDEDEDLIIPALNNSVQEYTIEDTDASAKQERALSSYILPGNADWGLLEMHFLDGHVVRLSYPGLPTMKFTYTEMGFVNERTMLPDRKWEMLKEIADRGGYLTNEYFNPRYHRNIKYELSKGLKRFFGMTTSSIPRYTRRDGYATLFVIQTDR